MSSILNNLSLPSSSSSTSEPIASGPAFCGVPSSSSQSCEAPGQISANFLDQLPQVVIHQIAEMLDFGSKLNFMKSSQRVHNTVSSTFKKFNIVQISDEPFDSFVKVESRSLPNGTVLPEQRLSFDAEHILNVFDVCPNLTTVVLAVKVQGSKAPSFHQTSLEDSTNDSLCPLFGTSMYAPGGYIRKFFEILPGHIQHRLESVCLHVDLSVDSFSELVMPCPTEDLRFAVHYLADKPFQTFVQIAFCASEITDNDNVTNCMLLAAMHSVAHEMRFYGCKTMIDFGEDEYYCDLTVFKGNLEYSFAFFYYNPQFCEPGTSSANSSLNNFDPQQPQIPFVDVDMSMDLDLGLGLDMDFNKLNSSSNNPNYLDDVDNDAENIDLVHEETQKTDLYHVNSFFSELDRSQNKFVDIFDINTEIATPDSPAEYLYL